MSYLHGLAALNPLMCDPSEAKETKASTNYRMKKKIKITFIPRSLQFFVNQVFVLVIFIVGLPAWISKQKQKQNKNNVFSSISSLKFKTES